MTSDPRSIAFDPAAPADERFDAHAALAAQYKPLTSALLPDPAVREVIDWIQADLDDQAMIKAHRAKVIPFPGDAPPAKHGMQSVFLDRYQIAVQGDYFEKPSPINFDALRAMVEQTPVLSAVVMTRIRQIARFCQPSEDGGPGFELRHIDRKHELAPEEERSLKLLAKFFRHCGWEFNPRRRRQLKRDNFAQFMAKLVRDSLTMDAAAIETEMKAKRDLGIDGLYAIDGATLRLCSEAGYEGDDELFAVQVIQGQVRTAYTYDDLIYEPRNPRTDVRLAGYGLGETELLIRVVTGFLNAMTLNLKGFSDNSIPRGILHLSGDYSQEDLAAFKRYWNQMVKGVNNAWSLPIMVSKDQESKAEFAPIGVEFNEMYFSKWMTFLTSMICAVYGMSPDEINFESFTAGKSSLSGSDTAEKLADSKDKGLRPLLSYFESTFTDFIVADFSDKYVFRWVGLDDADEQKEWEAKKLILTVNELRAEQGYEAMDGPLGDAPLNPSLMGPWMQVMQAQQSDDFGQPEGPDGPPGEDGNQGDENDDDDPEPPPNGQKKKLNPQPDAHRQPPDTLNKANPHHDDLGKFTSIFVPARTPAEQRGLIASRSPLQSAQIPGLAHTIASALFKTTPVGLPDREDATVRQDAFQAAKQVAAHMRAQGLAIRNHSSGALIELSPRGLKHAKTMSGDLRAALLLYKLPTALARAIYVKSETPDARKHRQQQLVAYHKFAIPIQYRQTLALALLHVEEDQRGRFYYDASLTPELKKLDGTSGASIAGNPGDRETGLHQALVQHIQAALEVKPDLSELHTFFHKACAAVTPATLSLPRIYTP